MHFEMVSYPHWTCSSFVFILVLGLDSQLQIKAERTAHTVNECPRNETEWRKASSRLNCSEDDVNPENRYHCLPDDGLTNLLEFCYNRTRAQVITGLCMVYVERKNILHSSNCSMFKEGCPNITHYSDETYKFPKCTEINPVGRCYIAFCPPVTDQEELNEEGPNILVIVLPIILGVLGVLLAGFCIYRRRVSQRNIDKPYEEQQQPLLNLDSTVKIPQEISYWNPENKKKFVSIITSRKMSMSVFSGSGMVIGCAEAGKTTLVKKLKGEKDLTPEFTMGLEIHPHEFKLDDEESTITVCTGKEKEKGCLCITLEALGYKENNKPDDSKTNYIRRHSTALIHGEQQDSPAMAIALKKETGSSTTPVEICQESDTPTNSFNTCTDPVKGENQAIANDTSQECLDLSDCPVNEHNLKMLSLLDFAGHSAYYACHHIFFSPRAFFILVVDMTKDLQSVATDACKEPDLIYSKWTFGDYIKYWLGSIHTYSSTTAPVILVGTHYDKKTNPNEKESEILQRFFEDICSLLPSSLKHHLNQERVFCVKKRSGKNMRELNKCIAKTLKSQAHWGDSVPLSWIKIQTLLKDLKSKKTYLFTKLNEDVQKDLHISEEELIRALTFFHEVGMVMFRSEIKDIIILDVQWFVDAFKCIIMDKRHCRKDIYALDDYKDLGLSGLLSKKLLDDLWKDDEFQSNKTNLVNHMKQLDMLATLSEDLWYVPCMNKQQYSQDILDNCNVSSTLCFLFEFLPFVIFHRLIVACINKLGMEPWIYRGKKCIYHTVTILSCKETNQRLLIGIRENKNNFYPEHSYSIELQAMETKKEETDRGFFSTNTNIKENICEILKKLTKTFPSSEKSFRIGYRCKIEPYSKTPESNIILKEEIGKLNVDCSMCKPVHVVQDAESILSAWECITEMSSDEEEEKEHSQH